jgi:hypothetical protein
VKIDSKDAKEAVSAEFESASNRPRVASMVS